MAGLTARVRLARNALGVLAGRPSLLLYPVVAVGFAFGFGLVAFLLASAFGVLFPPLALLGYLAYLVAAPVGIAFCLVGYCYQLDETFEGRSPSAIAGFRVAADRIRLVLAAGMVFAVGGLLTWLSGFVGTVGQLFGQPSRLGMQVTNTFAIPAVALGNGDFQDSVDEVVDAVSEQWDSTLVAVVGMRALGALVVVVGFLVAGCVLLVTVDGTLPPSLGIVLALLVLTGAVVLAPLLTFTVDGMIKVALYRHAVDGSFPDALGVGPEALLSSREREITPPSGRFTAWLDVARYEAWSVASSWSVWSIGIATAVATGIAAFVLAEGYRRGVDAGLDAVQESTADVEAALTQRELEAAELAFGTSPSRGDLEAALVDLQSTGDLPAALVLSTLVLGLGPLLGVLVTVPGIVRQRANGEFEGLLDAGYGRLDVLSGVYLGRLVGVAIVVGLSALATSGAVWNRLDVFVGGAFLAVTLVTILLMGVFAAFGTMIATITSRRLTAVLGSLVVVCSPYLLSGNPIGDVSFARNPTRGGAVDTLLTPPWGSLPAVIPRFNPYNVITDSIYLYTLSSVVESMPRVSYVGLAEAINSDVPAHEALAELPVYLQHWFVYVVIAIWILVPLTIAAVLFQPSYE